MLTGRGTSALSLLFVVATASSASTAVSCRSKTAESLDASSDAGPESGAPAPDDAATTTTPPNDGGAAAPSASGASASPMFSNLPLPTPFTGDYRCFKSGLHLEQSGSLVMSTMHKDGTTDTIIACTAFGDTCTGTVRDIHLVKSKTAKKVDAVRPITLLRTKGGDVIVKVGHEQKPAGAKSTTSSSSSKAAAGDETFCPRR